MYFEKHHKMQDFNLKTSKNQKQTDYGSNRAHLARRFQYKTRSPKIFLSQNLYFSTEKHEKNPPKNDFSTPKTENFF